MPARAIANALRDICKKILIERSLAQSSSKLIGGNNRHHHSERAAKATTGSASSSSSGHQAQVSLLLGLFFFVCSGEKERGKLLSCSLLLIQFERRKVFLLKKNDSGEKNLCSG